jgi:hypothetical protein
MSKIPILQADQSYTFPSYFEMSYGADEILAEFGYTFATDRIPLPKTEETLNWVPELLRFSNEYGTNFSLKEKAKKVFLLKRSNESRNSSI